MVELLKKYKILTEDGLLLLISFGFHDENNSIKNLAKGNKIYFTSVNYILKDNLGLGKVKAITSI